MTIHRMTLSSLQLRRAALQAAGQRRRPRKIPRQQFPTAARLAYYAALRKMLAELRAQVEHALRPALQRALQVKLDGPADDLKVVIDQIEQTQSPQWQDAAVDQLARAIAQSVSVQNREQIDAQLQAGLGFKLFPTDPNLSDHLNLFVADNVRLVSSIRSDLLDELHGVVLRAARSDDREELQREIAERFDVADSRAELIAVDQVGSLNGELTRMRHQSAGITEYVWDTSHDSRVRYGHQLLQGTRQTWGKPPVENPRTGDRGEPGKPIRCRCVAIPVVDDLVRALES